ncbi:hypothetical protein EVAR_92374_1 [Eumeta japonica]|uniref:Uncharacterized protein n=1 Tax=Eumeta variegata TaxID=151549 RepID=A0A4C1TIP4_EUMVA|nr:hypothetical protein EVAR_92374_1 [Eumeta japonica]
MFVFLKDLRNGPFFGVNVLPNRLQGQIDVTHSRVRVTRENVHASCPNPRSGRFCGNERLLFPLSLNSTQSKVKQAGEPSDSRQSLPPMDTCNHRGDTNALLASWEGIRYLMENNRIDGKES